MTENDQPNNFELQNISVPGVNKIANNEHHNRTQRDNSSSGIASYLPFNFNLYNNYQHQQGDDQASRRGWIQQSSNHDRQPQTPERDDGAAKGNTRAKNTVVGPLEQPNWPRRHWRLLVFLLLMLLVIPGITAPLAIHFENRSNDKGSRTSNTFAASPSISFAGLSPSPIPNTSTTLARSSNIESNSPSPAALPVATSISASPPPRASTALASSPAPSPAASEPPTTATPTPRVGTTPRSTSLATTAKAKVAAGASCKGDNDCDGGLCYTYSGVTTTCCGANIWGCPGYDCAVSGDNGCLDPFKCATTGTKTCLGF